MHGLINHTIQRFVLDSFGGGGMDASRPARRSMWRNGLERL